MRHFAVSAVGRDRPGIVAAVSQVLLDHEGNVEDSQMTILRGHFTMMLIVSAPDEVDSGRLEADLAAVCRQLDLEAVSVSEVTEIGPDSDPVPSYIVSVYGGDHRGIVHAVSAALAERDISITDLETHLTGGGRPLYAMMMEIATPEGCKITDVEKALRGVGEQQGVEVAIRPLDQDAL